MTDKILLDVSDQIVTITFNNPERRNAITFEMWHELRRILRDLKHDPEVRVIVFRGSVDEAFSAGADISEFETRRKNAAQAALYNAAFDAAMDEAEAVGKPTKKVRQRSRAACSPRETERRGCRPIAIAPSRASRCRTGPGPIV